MKPNNKDTFTKSLIQSGIFLPLVIFIFATVANNILFLQKNYTSAEWQFFYALSGGCAKDIFVFTFIGLFLSLICKFIPLFKYASVVILYFLSFLPIIDFLYFRATLQRFNPVALQFVNFHSTKGYIGNLGNWIYLLLAGILLFTFFLFLSCMKKKIILSNVIKPFSAFCILCFSCSVFTSDVKLEKQKNFTGHIKTIEGKNKILKQLADGSVHNFIFPEKRQRMAASFMEYSKQEKDYLKKVGLITEKTEQVVENSPKFKRIIMIVLESFALEYLNTFNKAIPKEASEYLDYLYANYPHSDNFYTSDFPSLQGFNAILSSRIPFDETSSKPQKYNIARLLEEKTQGSTYFLRGSSRVYGGEDVSVSTVFGFSHLIGYEDLTAKYPEPPSYTWGYMDNILFSEAVSIMEQNKDKEYFMVLKLLNQHQPIFDLVSEKQNQPASVSSHRNEIVKAIYDADCLIKQFLSIAKADNLFDDDTLFILTADHYPPLGYGHTELVTEEFCSQLGKLPLVFISNRNQFFSGMDSKTISCQLDIAPTLCYLKGLKQPGEYLGQNLLQTHRGMSLGVLNGKTLTVKTEELDFSESLYSPATTTASIKKWINNLTAAQD